MTRTAKRILMACLFTLSTAVLAHASEYPFTVGAVDISVNNLSIASTNGSGVNETLNLTGSAVSLPNGSILPGGQVMTIIDLPGTSCDGSICNVLPALSFTANASGFTITGQTVEAYNSSLLYSGSGFDTNPADNATTTYLSGSFVAGSFLQSGNDYGELFKVNVDNVAEWTALEELSPNIFSSVYATNLNGDQVALDFDSLDGGTADLEPWTATATPEPASLTLLCSGLAAGLLRKRLARKKA